MTPFRHRWQFLIPAGYTLPANLELRDALRNLIAHCISTTCLGNPTTIISASLIQNGRPVRNDTGLVSDQGLAVPAVGGTIGFPSLRVEKAGLRYTIAFTAQARGAGGRVVSVQSSMFHVTNGPPTTMLLSQASNRSADSEVSCPSRVCASCLGTRLQALPSLTPNVGVVLCLSDADGS